MAPTDKQLQLLAVLADGHFHSGEALARQFDVSRAAIWKQLRRCRDGLGVEVDSVRGRGYRLRQPFELLSAEHILTHLADAVRRRIGTPIVFTSVDSTNTRLMSEARGGAPGGTVCLAERQTAGRGRHGRTWISPFGSNIYLSMLWRYPLAPVELSGLSLACGVAVARALNRVGVDGHALKWPNDVLWGRRKLAGLLLEVGGEAGGPSFVVAGIGINTRLEHRYAAAIEQPWIDLASIPGVEHTRRNHIAAVLIEELAAALEGYARAGLRPFIDDWRRYDHFQAEQVVLSMGARQVTGSYLGIDESGAIRLGVEGGTVSYNVGEVTLCRPGT